MKGSHPNGPGNRFREQRGKPFGHLPSSLVGKGEGKDLFGLGLPGLNLVGNPVGQGHGFSSAGACHDQEVSALMKHSLSLRGIQRTKNGIPRLYVLMSRRGWCLAGPRFLRVGFFMRLGRCFRPVTEKRYLTGKRADLGRIKEAYGAVFPVVALLADHLIPPHSLDGFCQKRAAGLFNIL